MIEIINSDAMKGLLDIPEASVDMCITSPPYFNLRDYGVSGQIGLEKTPDEYIQRLLDVFRGVRKALRDDGTLWVVIGDTYAGKGYRGGGDPSIGNRNIGDKKYPLKTIPTGCKKKDLIGIPWMLAFALRSDGWYLRQDIVWSKPNAMPESVTDRCTRSHEYVFMFSKQIRYRFNADAIAEPVVKTTSDRFANGLPPRYGGNKYQSSSTFQRTKSGKLYEYRTTRNKRDVWNVSTEPFSGSHFAVFPKELIRPCILAGSSRNGIVLDPFFGSGTTGIVAEEEGRNCIGIEINPEYVEIAKRRISNLIIQEKIFDN